MFAATFNHGTMYMDGDMTERCEQETEQETCGMAESKGWCDDEIDELTAEDERVLDVPILNPDTHVVVAPTSSGHIANRHNENAPIPSFIQFPIWLTITFRST